jgi:hypothetical protein
MGRIRSLRTGNIIRPAASRGGYLVLVLQCRPGRPDARKSTVRVNKVVLEAFTRFKPKDPRKIHAAHKNSIRDDNRIENLYWATYAENLADKIRHGKIPKGEASKRSKLKEHEVRLIHKLANEGVPTRVLGNRFKISAHHATCIRDKRTWRHLWATDNDQKYTEGKD